MDEELRELLINARMEGASDDDLFKIREDYLSQKKKDSSPLESTLETGSMDSTSPEEAQESPVLGSSDSIVSEPQAPILDQRGEVLSPEKIRGLYDFALNIDKTDRDYVLEQFDLDRYAKSEIGETPATLRETSSDTFLSTVSKKVKNRAFKLEGIEERMANRDSLGEHDRDKLKSDIIDTVTSLYGGMDAGMVELLKGIDDSYSKQKSPEPGIWENLKAGFFGGKETSDEAFEDSMSKFRADRATAHSEAFLKTLPEEKRNDPEYLQELENWFNKEQGIVLDLTGDGYSFKKEGRYHISADFIDNVGSGIHNIGAGVWQEVLDASYKLGAFPITPGGKQVEAHEEFRKQSLETDKRILEDVRTPMQSTLSKWENRDYTGWAADNFTNLGRSLPPMMVAIGMGAVTKNRAAIASATGFAHQAITYNEVRDEDWFNNLSPAEQVMYIGVDAAAETFGDMVGARAFRNSGKSLFEAIVDNVGAKKVAGVMVNNLLSGASNEALAEGLTGFTQYTNNIYARRAAGEDVEFDLREAAGATKESALAGAFMGTFFSGAGNVVAMSRGLAKTSTPSVKSNIVIKQLQQEYTEAKTREERADVGKRLTQAIHASNKARKERAIFYEEIGKENEADLVELGNLQAKILKLSVDYTKADSSKKGRIKEQIKTLVEQRSEIESKYDAKYNVDSSVESKRILSAATKLDNRYGGYGEIFDEGTESTTVTAENVDEVSQKIEEAGIEDINLDLKLGIGKVTNHENVRKGLQNAMKVVRSLAKMGKNTKVIIHKTMDSFTGATGKAPSRGLWTDKDEIHLFAPALKSSTAYHEAYHDFVIEQVGKSGVSKLAQALANGLRGKLKDKYAAFLTNYNKGEKVSSEVDGNKEEVKIRVDKDNIAKTIEQNPDALAEEFLVEVLADITSDNVSIEMKKGLIDSLKDFVGPVLGKVGINISFNDTKLSDLVDAIKKTTGQLKKGEKVEVSELNEASSEGGSLYSPTGKRASFDPEQDSKAQTIGNTLFSEGVDKVSSIADNYYKSKFGKERPSFKGVSKIDVARAKDIASFFEEMDSKSSDPTVLESYRAMADETLEQYESMVSAGYVIEVANSEPYTSSKELIDDIRNNERIKILSTESEFGDGDISSEQRESNPLLGKTTKVDINGKPLLVNDIFRAVHDFFGHAELGNSFGPIGEENAWSVHVRMFSPLAARAMTTETRGQNSWVNFSGVNDFLNSLREEARRLRREGDFEQAAKITESIYSQFKFAEQKTGLLPAEMSVPDSVLEDKPPIDSKIETLNKEEGTSPEEQTKAQDDLISLIADFIDRSEADPNVKKGVGQFGEEYTELEKGEQLSTFGRKKEEVIEMLQDSGLSKASAEEIYRAAKIFKEGRVQGKKLTEKRVVKTVKKQLRLTTTEAKNLRKSLQELKDKSETVAEFRKAARELIAERGKEFKVPFSLGQIKKMFEIAMSANKVSAKNLAENGDAVMDTFIERITKIFDAQDKKQALKDYLDAVSAAKSLQGKINRKLKPTKKGKALRSKASYFRAASELAGINAALIDSENIGGFLSALSAAHKSLSTVKAVKDKETGEFDADIPSRTSADDLQTLANTYLAVEEAGRLRVLQSKAENAVRRVEKAGGVTTLEEEIEKLENHYERMRLTKARRDLEDAIDKHNESNPDDLRSISNPSDVEVTLDEMAALSAELNEIKKSVIIDDAIIPVVEKNLHRLLEDPDIQEILGVNNPDSYDNSALKDRLSRVSNRVLVELEYKLSNYISNGDAYGIGYLKADFVAIDGEDAINDFMRSNPSIKAVRPKLLWVGTGLITSLESYTRQMFPQINRKKLAVVRKALKLGKLYNAFAKADVEISHRNAGMLSEIEAITKEGGSVGTVSDSAIMQIFSMARQIPEGLLPAQWYNALKDSMRRTIDHYDTHMQSTYSLKDITDLNEAYEFLFSDTNSIDEVVSKVQDSRSDDIVRFVDYVVSMHKSNETAFATYVSRFLGKELKREDNYTHFSIRRKAHDASVDEAMDIRNQMIAALTNSSINNIKKVAGASYERNSAALTAEDSMIGLDFIRMNENTMKENIILQHSVETVAAMSKLYKSESFESLIPSDKTRRIFKSKIASFIGQDIGSGSGVMASRFIVPKSRVRFRNPLLTIRRAVDVRAFGGWITQTLKQSTVLITTAGNTYAPTKTVPYLTSKFGELWVRSLELRRLYKDNFVVLSQGEDALLRHSSVFMRDYQDGMIEASTGAMEFSQPKLVKAADKLRNLSLRNLKKTDKLAAVAGFFAFYGDYLISEGKVESFSDIDWESEGRTPHEEALDYANSMVSKTQGPSTAREQADVFMDDGGKFGNIISTARDLVFRYTRFAFNKKAEILSAIQKTRKGEDAKTRVEGATEFISILGEQATFHIISGVVLTGIASALAGGDDEEDKQLETLKKSNRTFYKVLGNIVRDMIPTPPIPVMEDALVANISKYVIFPSTTNLTEDYKSVEGDTYNDKYERWLKDGKGIPTFMHNPDVESADYVLGAMGVYGDFVSQLSNNVSNLKSVEDDGKITSIFGKEYYVRPEDKEDIKKHYLISSAMMMLNMTGIGLKEVDIMNKTIDDIPKSRALGSKEEQLGYNLGLADRIIEEHGPTSELLEKCGVEDVVNDLNSRIDAAVTESDKKAIENKAKKGYKVYSIEKMLESKYPDYYDTFIGDIKNLARAKDEKELQVMRRGVVQDIRERYTSEEFDTFKALMHDYLVNMSSGNKMVEANQLDALDFIDKLTK